MQPPPAPHRHLAWDDKATWLLLSILVLAYFGAAQIGLLFELSDAVASPIWPPAGLAVAAAVLWGRRVLPAIFVGVLAVELTAGVPPLGSLLMAVGNTVEAAAAAALVARQGGRHALHRLPGVLALAAGAALAPLAAASTGALGLYLSGIIPAAALLQVWGTWYLGDVAGILVVAPAILLFPAWRMPRLAAARLGEGVAAFAFFVVAASSVFGLVGRPLAFLAMPPLVWLAMRFGPFPTALSLLTLDTLAIFAIQNGRGPFGETVTNTAYLILQAYILTMSMLGLTVAAMASDRRRAREDLEHRVAERTALFEQANRDLQGEVAERRRAQEAVDEAQRVAHMGTWYWDITKPNAEWSPELYRIYGLDAATHVPTYADYLTRVHPEDVERVKAATDAVFQHKQPYSHDERIRRPDGTWRALHTWARAVTDASGKLVGLAGACQDITEHEAARTALDESLQRFRALAESSPIGIVHTTPQGVVDYANKAWMRITGVADFRDADRMRAAVHPEDQPRSAAIWRASIKDAKPFRDEMRWVLPDGSVRLTACQAEPVRDATGQLTGFVSTVEDITDLRAAEDARRKELEARQEMRRLQEQADFKTNFLRTAAHELGTPLTPIRLQLSVLRRLMSNEDQEKAFNILERNLDRLNVLVKDLLESARLQSNRLRINPRPMDLAAAVHEVAETFQEPAIQTGISLDTRGAAVLPMVADPDRITQVLYNLLSNAMKFTPPRGHVTVTANAEGDTVRIEVKDNGQGFTSEQASRLFQPFSQVHDAMQTTRAGSGLGLYICRGIVEQHGGTIAAHSDGPGKGATFTVRLPREAMAPTTAQPVPDAPVVPRSGLGLRAN